MSVTPTVGPLITIDLLSWQEGGSLELTPKFQRKTVWSPAAKSYLIDSLLAGYPVPPIHIRMGLGRSGLQQRQVIDGQQRLHTVFDFVRGKFAISSRIDSPWAGKRFEDLDAEARESILLYKFYVYQYEKLDDQQVLEIFARLNTYSVSLNKQELRNGKFFGAFKSTAYELAVHYLDFWRASGLFTEQSIARMRDAELVSELLVMLLDGPQDKKTSIDGYYAALDEDWGVKPPVEFILHSGNQAEGYLSRAATEERFRGVLDEIATHLIEDLRPNRFNRTPLFYSLFQSVAHRMYGVPEWEAVSPHSSLTDENWSQLRESMVELGELLNADEDELANTRWQQTFVNAASRQTDNYQPRVLRATTIWERAGLGVQ